MSGNLALTGVFSNIDSDTLVRAAMAAEQQPLTRLQNQRTSWDNKIKALDDVSAPLQDLLDLVESMRSVQDVRHTAADSSDSASVRAVAGSGATEGSHSVLINRLASAEKEVHAGVTPTEAWTAAVSVDDPDEVYLTADDISDAGGDNYKFVFQFGSESAVAVDLSAYDATGITLNQLVSEINTAAGYTAASAVADGAAYKLRIAAQNSGSGHDLVITDDHSVAALDSTGDLVQTVDGGTGSDALVGAGQFVYTYNGTTRTITTTAGTNLGQLRDLINNDGGNPGVTASLLEYQGATGGRYHLVLTGHDTGSDYGIAVEAATTLAGFGGADWTQTQTAQDSRVRVDGYPPTDWIESSGNVVTDVIPGVTLTLMGTTADDEPVTVAVNRSASQFTNDLQNLVNIYNAVVDRVSRNTGYDADTSTAGVLMGDSSLLDLINRVRSVLIGTPPGFDAASDTFTLAVQIGLSIDKDGKLSLDQEALSSAMAADYDAVLKLIGASGIGSTGSPFVQYNSADSQTTPGTYELKVEYAADGSITAAYFRTKGEGDDDWRAATVEGSTIVGAAGGPERWLQVTASPDPAQAGSPYTLTTEVRVVQGLGGALYDALNDILDSTDGALAIKKQRYQAAMDQLDDRITREQEILDAKEQRLREKYARLEATLAQLDSFRAAYQSLFDMLDYQSSQTQKTKS